MNKSLKNIVVSLCIISMGSSLHAVEAAKLLQEYSLRADRYKREQIKTERAFIKFFAAGAAVSATVLLHRKWHVNLLKAFLEGGLPAAGTTLSLADFISPLIRPFVKWLHKEHRLFGFRLPISLSNALSRKQETVATIKRSLTTNDPIDPVRMRANPTFSHDPVVLKLLGKIEAQKTEANNPKKTIPERVEIAGGLEREILEIILYMVDPARAQALGKRMSRGILFYGPSGTGKTLKAAQIAARVQAAMKDCVVGELKNMWQGGSEENIREMFGDVRQRVENLENLPAAEKQVLARLQRTTAAIITLQLRIIDLDEQIARAPEAARQNLVDARRPLADAIDAYNAQIGQEGNHDEAINNLLLAAGMDPAQEPEFHPWGVVFVDEIDAFGSRSGSHNGSDVSNGMITQLLGQMDGADKDKNSKILVIGTTNRVDMLDQALLRPGRFDKQVYMGIPANAAQRLEFLNFFGTLNNPPAKGRYHVEAVVRDHFQEIANLTANFSQAELDGLFSKASDFAMVQNSPAITQEHMNRALQFMLEKKNREHRNTFAQQLAYNDVPKYPLNAATRLEHFKYYCDENGVGSYQIEPAVRQNFEDQNLRNELIGHTAFFTGQDIKDVFEIAAGLAIQNNHQMISWQDLNNAVQRIRLRKRMVVQRLAGDHAEAQPQAQQNQQPAPQAVPQAVVADHPAEQPAGQPEHLDVQQQAQQNEQAAIQAAVNHPAEQPQAQPADQQAPQAQQNQQAPQAGQQNAQAPVAPAADHPAEQQPAEQPANPPAQPEAQPHAQQNQQPAPQVVIEHPAEQPAEQPALPAPQPQVQQNQQDPQAAADADRDRLLDATNHDTCTVM